ncbi:hypothetical protein [Novosphingobium sp. PASSN1]|nr:hypothetical protein [Novosphingobium sp. PASSN1]
MATRPRRFSNHGGLHSSLILVRKLLFLTFPQNSKVGTVTQLPVDFH